VSDVIVGLAILSSCVLLALAGRLVWKQLKQPDHFDIW
jgi:hypothetical protein